MKKLLVLYLFVTPGFLFAQENVNHELQDTSQHIVPGRTNRPDQMKKSYVILISADGFRYDLADKYQAENLLRLRKSGVSADHMQSVFPSLTFPNHYSIITGDYPDHNGIVDNTFYSPSMHLLYSMSNRKMVDDSSWYGAMPLWVLAEQQGMLTASYYWVGAESAIQGVRPTYYYKFNSLIPMKKRIEGVRDWLLLPEDKRPHLINFYIPDVDHQEHMYGVSSRQTEEAVHYVDNAVALLVRTVDSLQLSVSYIFVSDHGMTDLDTVNGLTLPERIDTNKFLITSSLSLVHIYVKKKTDILPTYTLLKSAAKNYDVYLTTNTPARWHYNKKNDHYNRIGDILLVARPPKAFKLGNRGLPAATHGFDPAIPDMYATFYAWGPAFRKNLKIHGFENIHIYPLITEILHLKITEPVDGSIKILRPILK